MPSSTFAAIESLSLATLRPAYVLAGEESFFRDRFRFRLIGLLVPAGTEAFSIFDEDLGETSLGEILSRAQTSSLLAPAQIFFIHNIKYLLGRQRKQAESLEALYRYLKSPAPATVLVFVADHLRTAADPRELSFEDRERWERLETTFGASCQILACGCAAPEEARQLVRMMAAELGCSLAPEMADLLLEMVADNLGEAAREIEKLAAYASGEAITTEMILDLAADRRSVSIFELAARLGSGSRREALAALTSLWSKEGNSVAIPLVYQLSRFFKMALLVRRQRVRDRRALYQTLPQGLRPQPLAAESVLAMARLPEATLTTGIGKLQVVDVSLRSNPLSAQLVLEQAMIEIFSTIPSASGR